MKDQSRIFTVGHSNHSLEQFIRLLKQHGVTALADVRSAPYSRNQPQFNRETLAKSLQASLIKYVFLGDQLGGRSKDPNCYERGRVQYRRMAATTVFQHGLERLMGGASKYRVVIMCAEREPLGCHRTLLVARELEDRGFLVTHIHGDGRLETHVDATKRLLRQLNMPESDLFRSKSELIDDAYAKQEEQVAYRTDSGSGLSPDVHDR